MEDDRVMVVRGEGRGEQQELKGNTDVTAILTAAAAEGGWMMMMQLLPN